MKTTARERMQMLRKGQNMTQKQLSELTGLNLRSLQNYEQGRIDLNTAEARTIYILAKALRCKMEDLLDV